MANAYTSQVLLDGDRNYVIKLTGVLDTSDEPLTTVVDVSTMSPVPTRVRIDKLDIAISDQITVELYWDANTPVLITSLTAFTDVKKFKHIGGLQNNAGVGINGNIKLQTQGWASGVQTYSLVLWCVKQGTPWSQT